MFNTRTFRQTVTSTNCKVDSTSTTITILPTQ
jgi:hypothetical protein